MCTIYVELLFYSFCSVYCINLCIPCVIAWLSGSALVLISNVTLYWAQLLLVWVTVLLWQTTSVYNQPYRPTQPGHPSLHSWILQPALWKKQQVLWTIGPSACILIWSIEDPSVKILCIFYTHCMWMKCFDAVGWAAEGHPACKKLSGEMLAWLCLGQGADLHMAQLMLLPLTISCCSKSRLVLPFWSWLSRVVLDKM